MPWPHSTNKSNLNTKKLLQKYNLVVEWLSDMKMLLMSSFQQIIQGIFSPRRMLAAGLKRTKTTTGKVKDYWHSVRFPSVWLVICLLLPFKHSILGCQEPRQQSIYIDRVSKLWQEKSVGIAHDLSRAKSKNVSHLT